MYCIDFATIVCYNLYEVKKMEETPITLTGAIKKGIEDGTEFNKSVRQRRHKIAERIKLIRLKNGLSQTKLCEAIKVNRITYSGYENERAEPSAEVLVRIAKYFNVSLDYLCCRTENPFGLYEKQTENEVSKIDAIQAQIVDLQKQLNEIKQK